MLDDVRQTFRFLVREPLLAVAMLVTLALGIGITTAIFSVLDAVIIRPLPYKNPDQLVVVWQQDRTDGSWFTVSPANFLDWQRQTGTFDALAAVQQFQDVEFNLTSDATPQTVKGVHFSSELFRVLGVTPVLGRPFTSEDAEPGHNSVVILGHELWVSRFGADRGIVGRDIRLNGENVTVIGVMPTAFEVPNEVTRAQLFLPLGWTAAQRQERRIANYLVLGRLKNGVGRTRAAADLDAFARQLEREYPASNKDTGVLLDPLRDQVVGTVRPSLLVIFAAAAGVLLLACFNLANLLTARGIKRQRELSVRAALGASRWRLLRQTLTEGFVIAFLGGVAGLTCAAWAVRSFVGLFNDTRYFSLPRRAEIAFDRRVFVFVAVVCVATGLLFSAAPAVRAMKADIVSALRRPDGRMEGRWRSVLMSAELAVSLALVVASLLLVRSYLRLHGESPGFSPDDVLTAKIALPNTRYSTPARRAAFFRSVLAQASGLPNAGGVAAVQLLPLNGVGSLWSISTPDQAVENLPAAFHFIISPGYFETMKMPLLSGRAFVSQDAAGRPRVAVLSQSAAQRYFPDGNPIGRTIRINDRENVDWQVVGVVGDVRNQRLDHTPRPQVYVPMDQSPAGSMTVVMRSRNHDPLSLARPLRDIVQHVDEEQGLADVKTMVQVVDDSSARWRVSTYVFLGFAGIALVLALIGLYSVTSFNVAQRSREIALRLALGDSQAGIVRLILRSLSRVAVAGVVVGLVLALMIGRALSSLLYAVRPVDPIAFASASLGFLILVLIAGTLSAFKASNIEPITALKAE
jgi:putative ABC transport system permease protein